MWNFLANTRGKEPACQCRRHKRPGFNPWVGTIPWRRAQQPTVFLPGESCGQRSLVGYSPWGHKESDMTEVTQYTRVHKAIYCFSLRMTCFHYVVKELGSDPGDCSDMCCPCAENEIISYLQTMVSLVSILLLPHKGPYKASGCLLLFFFNKAQLIYNVALISGIQQSDSYMCINIYTHAC